MFYTHGTNTRKSVLGGWDAIRAQKNGPSRGTWGNRRWGEILSSITDFQDPADKKIDQKIRKNTPYISFVVRSNTENTYYELSHLSLLFTYIGTGIEFLSQKDVIKI